MKSSRLTCITIMTLFAALAVPVRLAAQEQQQENQKHTRYKLIDVETFGGAAAYLSCCEPVVQDLNNRGTIAGGADTSIPDPFPSFCFNADCLVAHAFQWQRGVLTDLGALPGGASSFANWISANGLIAGNSQNGQIDPLFSGFPENRAVLWNQGRIIDLGTLEGGHESFSSAVNNRAQVVGVSNNTIPDPFSLLGDGYQVRAFLWEEGVMQDLGTLGGPDAFTTHVNERGQVAGFSYTNFTPNPVTGIPTQAPFLWENGKMLNLGTLGGTFGFPQALNNRGQVVGQSNLAGDLTHHPFLWDGEVLKDLGTLGGHNGIANWISDAGDVVGGLADLPGSQAFHAFLWKHGVMTDLGAVDGDACSSTFGINSRGQVVGGSGLCGQHGRHGWLWENGGPVIDLNTLVPPNSGLQLTVPININDRGEIAGLGLPPGCRDPFACAHVFLLIPCEGDNSVASGCEDAHDVTNAAIQNNPSSVAETSTNVTHGRPISDVADTLRTRIGRRYPGFGIWPRR